MVDGLALCSCACVTCLWCSLLAMCFPKLYKKLQESDSSVCCAVSTTTKKKISRVIGTCKSSLNDNEPKKSSPIETESSNDPKCTVRIIRKTRLKQCHRNESEDRLCKSGMASNKRDTRYTIACTKPIDSGVQTDFYKRRRAKVHPEDSSSDDPAGNRRYKLRARLSHRRSCSDESLVGYRGCGCDVEPAGLKKSKKCAPGYSAKYKTPISYDCDDRRRVDISRHDCISVE